MAEFDRPTIAAGAGSAAVVDQGCAAATLRVYNYMTVGLLVTGLVAFFANQAAVSSVPTEYQFANGVYLTQFGATIYTSPLQWVLVLAPLAFVLALSFGINKMSAATAQLVFWAFAAVMGLSLSSIFLVYTGQSIFRTFFISAAMFGVTSLYGYTTKRDLTAIGSFLVMGLIGLIIASVVNMFWASSALSFGISLVGVVIFTGLAAWDTQKIKSSYSSSMGADVLAKGAIMGALSLYLDFINLFMMLLRLTGNQRN